MGDACESPHQDADDLGNPESQTKAAGGERELGAGGCRLAWAGLGRARVAVQLPFQPLHLIEGYMQEGFQAQ